MSFTHPSDENTQTHTHTHTHRHTRFKMTPYYSSQKKNNQTKTTHIPDEKHTKHPPITVSCRLQQLTHKHTHPLGVLSLMAARSESEELTSPANTVHPVCMRARQRAAVRTADVLLHITNMIYNQRI